jgi:hypothetical protein
MAEKRGQKEDLARLSENSLFARDRQSGHHIHLDDPDWIVTMIDIELVAVRRRVLLSSIYKH